MSKNAVAKYMITSKQALRLRPYYITYVSCYVHNFQCPTFRHSSNSLRGVGNRGAGGGGQLTSHFSWKLTKILEKYGFFLKIHVFCPPTFGLAPPTLTQVPTPLIRVIRGLLLINYQSRFYSQRGHITNNYWLTSLFQHKHRSIFPSFFLFQWTRFM